MEPLKNIGGDRKSKKYIPVQDRDINKRDKSYYLARLKRDHPDIYECFEAGKFSSVRAACIAAGIIKIKDNFQKATTIIDKLTRNETGSMFQHLIAKFDLDDLPQLEKDLKRFVEQEVKKKQKEY